MICQIQHSHGCFMITIRGTVYNPQQYNPQDSECASGQYSSAQLGAWEGHSLFLGSKGQNFYWNIHLSLILTFFFHLTVVSLLAFETASSGASEMEIFGYSGLDNSHDSLNRLSFSFPATLRELWKGCPPREIHCESTVMSTELTAGQTLFSFYNQNQAWVFCMQRSWFSNTPRSKYWIHTQWLVLKPNEHHKRICCRWICLLAGIKWMQHIRTRKVRSLCTLINSHMPGFQFNQFMNEYINPGNQWGSLLVCLWAATLLKIAASVSLFTPDRIWI